MHFDTFRYRLIVATDFFDFFSKLNTFKKISITGFICMNLQLNIYIS